jgi:tetratricopeptide (TPR) repeat protein
MNSRILLTCVLLVLLAAPTVADSTPQQLLASGQVDDALQILQQQTSRPIADAESYNLLCRAYFMLEEWDRAISACERASSLDPRNSQYFMWLGRVYGEKASGVRFLSALGLVKKVRSSFERAVELDPRNWEARTDLAEFYLEAPGIVGGGKDKARAQAEAIQPLNPAMAHWVLARLAEKNNDAAGAEREYRAEIAASQSSARSWFDLAAFLRHTHRLDEMDEALRKLESSPLDRPDALVDAASILLRADRDFPLGVTLLRRYLASPVEAAPAFKAHDLLGRILEKQGDKRGAAGEFRAALALAHTYARAQEALKRVEHE